MFARLATALFPALFISLLTPDVAAAATTSACLTGALSAYSLLASVPVVQQYCSSHYPIPAVTSTTTVKKTTTTTVFVTKTDTTLTTHTATRYLTDYVGSYTTTSVGTIYTTTVTVIVSGTSRSTHAKRAPASTVATTATSTAQATSTDILASFLSKGSVIVGQVCTCVEVPKTVLVTTTVTSTASVTKTRTTTETDTIPAFTTVYTATVSYTNTITDVTSTSTSTVTTTVTIAYPKTCSNPYNCPASVGSEPQICGESVSSGDNSCHCFQRVNGETICSDAGGGCGNPCTSDAECTGTDYQGYGYVCVTGTCCTGDDGQYTGICIPNDPNCQIDNSNAAKKERKKRRVYNEVFGMWMERNEL